MDPTHDQPPAFTNEPTYSTPVAPVQHVQPNTMPPQAPYGQPVWQQPVVQPMPIVQQPPKRRKLIISLAGAGVLFLAVISFAIWGLSHGAIHNPIAGQAASNSQSGTTSSISMQGYTASLFSIQYPNGWHNEHYSATDGSVTASEFTDGSDSSNAHGAKNGFMAVNAGAYVPGPHNENEQTYNELQANDLYQIYVVQQNRNATVTGYAETTGYQSSNPELSQPSAVVITAQLTSNGQVTAHEKVVVFTDSAQKYTYGIVEQVEASHQTYQDIFIKMEQSFKGA